MKKNKLYSGLLAVSALLMLSSCTSEDVSNVAAQPESNASTVVKFRLNSRFAKASTRAEDTESKADVTGLDNEKAIDHLYAVIFKNGKFFQILPTTPMDPSDPANEDYWQFDMGYAGSYTMYLLANPGTELVVESAGAVTGGSIYDLGSSAEAADYFKLVTTQTPGDYKTDTRFLMTSKAVYVPVEASNTEGTDATPSGGPVEMTRAAARIDIDARKLTNSAQTFKIKDVVVYNRYPNTIIERGLSSDMTLPNDVSNFNTCAQSTGYTYSSTGAPTIGEDVSGIVAVTDPAEPYTDNHTTRQLTPNIWDGIVYTYENKTALAADATAIPADPIGAGLTVVEIVGDMNGIEVKQRVVFAHVDNTDPLNPVAQTIPVERNHLYSIVLSLKSVPDEYAPFEYGIRVLDYKTGETVVYSSQNLTDQTTKPDFEVTDADGGTLKDTSDNAMPSDDASTTEFDESILNPGSIELSNSAHTIQLKVVSAASSARVVLVDNSDDTEKASSGLESLEQKSYTVSDADGKVTQVFEIKIEANPDNAPARQFAFRVENATGWSANNAYRTFTIKQDPGPVVP
ncbi:MAG: hypothetical protein IJ618_04225 [Prevotella sp.]|nr:hypothetical protein [Prevotella sp.]